jgi:ATP-dependent Clp protease protease subunit
VAETTDKLTKTPKPRALAELARLQAETAKLLAETEVAKEHALDAAVERKITEARAAQAALETEAAEIAVNDARRAEARYRASDGQNHVYQFDGAVNAQSVKACITTLSQWSRLEPGCAIEIVFNSPGGSVVDGFALWDFLTSLRTAVKPHYLTTVCRGMAASMAGILLQAGDKRVIGAESVLLVHEISFGAGGKIGEVEDQVEFAKMLTKRVLRIFENRTKMTVKQIEAKWRRTDWWLTSDLALELGFADEVR